MSITLAQLCEIPHLGLRVLGGSSALDRAVTWTHVSEIEDPSPWLEGGELLMSVGMRFPEKPAHQVAFLGRLAKREIAGFAISESAVSRLSPQLIAASNRLPLPLFSVSMDVAFIEVVKTVAAANEQITQRRLMKHINIFDTLHTRLGGSAGSAELFERLGELTGYHLYAATLGGQELLEGVPLPPERVREELLRGPLKRPDTVEDAYVVPINVYGQTVGHLVAIELSTSRAAGLVAVQHIGTIASLETERTRTLWRLADAYRARILEDMLAGSTTMPARRRHLSEEGFAPDQPMVLIALAQQEEAGLDAQETEALSVCLRGASVPYMLARLDTSYLLAPADEQAMPFLQNGNGIRGGISRPFGAEDEFGLARREALLALQISIRTGEPLVRSGQDLRHASALPADRPSLEALVRLILGPLIDYDAAHNTHLVASLRCYLESDRSLQAAAKELFLHTNSMAYRLRRIEEVTDRRLASIETQTDFWLALEAQRILALTDQGDLRHDPAVAAKTA